MKTKKDKTAKRLLGSILFMQLIGFLCICMLKYNQDLISENYRSTENKNYNVLLCLAEIGKGLYEHQNIMASYVMSGIEFDAEEVKSEAGDLQKKIEGLLVRCDVYISDLYSEEAKEQFENLRSSIKAYFNGMEILFETKNEGYDEMAEFLLDVELNYYISDANSNLISLEEQANTYLSEAKDKMNHSVGAARMDFIIGAIIFFVSTLIGTLHCRKMINLQVKYMKEAEAANKAKSSFLSNVSHEIRTPINAIIGLNEMVLRESKDENILNFADKIDSSSKGLLSLINDILDFSKIEAGKFDIIPDNYHIKRAIDDLWNMISIKAKQKNLELEFIIDPRIPQELYGDITRIKQVAINLLTNSVKYTKEGSVIFKVTSMQATTEEVILRFECIDTGMGINPEEIDKLTKPFERIDEKKNIHIEGTGLGLSIVNNLLALMGSKLEIDSKYGYGSNFSFVLIQKVINWDPIGEYRVFDKKETVYRKQEAILHASKAKILAADDNEVNRVVLQELLKRTGVQLDLAAGGREVVDMASRKKYDVILMDHRMPEIDGIEALHMIKNEGANVDTPVVIVTANAMNGSDEEYTKEGFVACISKPIDSVSLENTLLELLPKETLDTKEDSATFVDKEEGIKTCGGEMIYAKVVPEFIRTHQTYRDEIEKYKEEGDIKNYTIKVHALKSTARLVGALGLSEEAKYLEQCGREEKIEEIEKKTQQMLEHYDSIVNKLKLETEGELQNDI